MSEAERLDRLIEEEEAWLVRTCHDYEEALIVADTRRISFERAKESLALYIKMRQEIGKRTK